MKLFTVLCSLFVSSILVSQDIAPPTVCSISVSGTAEKSLPADRVRISVTVRSIGKELSDAQEKSSQVFSSVLVQLESVGIKKDKVELRDHELGKEYEQIPDGKRVHSGFYSVRDFLIELDNAALLEAVYADLAENPDVQVRGTSFSRKDEIQVRRELRRKALEAAFEKAEDMASVYDQKIGKVIKIAEGGAFGLGPTSFNTRNTMSVATGVEVRGRVSLSAQVSVVFELVE